MTKTELAIKVINLRKALKTANRLASDGGANLTVGVNEDQGPTFREGRKFWAEVRKLAGVSHSGMVHRAAYDQVVEENDRLKMFLAGLACDGCSYGDNCPPDANHYVCEPCHINRMLDEESKR